MQAGAEARPRSAGAAGIAWLTLRRAGTVARLRAGGPGNIARLRSGTGGNVARLRVATGVAALAWLLTAMMVLLVLGMFRNDAVIASNPVRTTATVLTVSSVSTGIEFVDSAGVLQRPPAGVLYPGGLRVGQEFLVEYDGADPTVARVAGRSAINGLVMPVFVVLGIWLPALPLLWWLRRPPQPRRRARARRRAAGRAGHLPAQASPPNRD